MKMLGIIGGLGPMATAYFMKLLTMMSAAETDQGHLDVAVISHPSIPDRTASILDPTKPSPVPIMQDVARQLASLGCTRLCTPCVTAHHFLPQIASATDVPFIDMVSRTAAYLKRAGKGTVGIMATSGTISTRLLQDALLAQGITPVVPDETGQKLVMSIIYDDVKSNRPAHMDRFRTVSDSLFSRGCDAIILGCTELSVVKGDNQLPAGFLDALEVLAATALRECGQELLPAYEDLITR